MGRRDFTQRAINFPKIVQQSFLYLELRRPGRLLDWRGALWAQTLTGAKSHRLHATDEISLLGATQIEKRWHRRAAHNADALTKFDKSGAKYRQRPLARPHRTGWIFGFPLAVLLASKQNTRQEKKEVLLDSCRTPTCPVQHGRLSSLHNSRRPLLDWTGCQVSHLWKSITPFGRLPKTYNRRSTGHLLWLQHNDPLNISQMTFCAQRLAWKHHPTPPHPRNLNIPPGKEEIDKKKNNLLCGCNISQWK